MFMKITGNILLPGYPSGSKKIPGKFITLVPAAALAKVRRCKGPRVRVRTFAMADQNRAYAVFSCYLFA